MPKIVIYALFVCSAFLAAFGLAELVRAVETLIKSVDVFFTSIALPAAASLFALSTSTLGLMIDISKGERPVDKEFIGLFGHLILSGFVLSILFIVTILEVPWIRTAAFLTLIPSVKTLVAIAPSVVRNWK